MGVASAATKSLKTVGKGGTRASSATYTGHIVAIPSCGN